MYKISVVILSKLFYELAYSKTGVIVKSFYNLFRIKKSY